MLLSLVRKGETQKYYPALLSSLPCLMHSFPPSSYILL